MSSRKILVACMLAFCTAIGFAEEPRSRVIRPQEVDAKVRGCRVAEPGDYSARVGDLVELAYSFPVVPDAMPEKVERRTDRGVAQLSKLGIRELVVPKKLGVQTYLFYFEAKSVGQGTAYVIVDDVTYKYHVDVSK